MTAGMIPSFGLPITAAIIATIIIEFIVYVIAMRQNIWKVLWYCFLINLFTVSLANLFYGILYTETNVFLFLIIEGFVFLVEFVLIMFLFRNKWWKALAISFVANLASMILGVFLLLLGIRLVY